MSRSEIISRAIRDISVSALLKLREAPSISVTPRSTLRKASSVRFLTVIRLTFMTAETVSGIVLNITELQAMQVLNILLSAHRILVVQALRAVQALREAHLHVRQAVLPQALLQAILLLQFLIIPKKYRLKMSATKKPLKTLTQNIPDRLKSIKI